MMVYPSYAIANLIADGRAIGTPGGYGHLLGLALLGALVMTAWDLVVDPVLSGPAFGAWVWENGGPYFGVPVQNYAGWIVTTFTVYVLYRMLERRWAPAPAGPLRGAAGALPILAYVSMMLSNLGSGGAPAALVVIAPIAMGMPAVAGAVRLMRGEEPPASEGRPRTR
jgi:putative membrane protein